MRGDVPKTIPDCKLYLCELGKHSFQEMARGLESQGLVW